MTPRLVLDGTGDETGQRFSVGSIPARRAKIGEDK